MKFTSEMMKKIHNVAKNMEGHFYCRLSLAFKVVLKEEKNMKMNDKGYAILLAEKKLRLADVALKQNIEEIKSKSSEDEEERIKKITEICNNMKEEISKIISKYSQMKYDENEIMKKLGEIHGARFQLRINDLIIEEIDRGLLVELEGQEIEIIDKIEDVNLAVLKGTEKQIKWATDIRAEKIQKLSKILTTAKESENKEVTKGQKEAVLKKISREIYIICNETEASKIIDDRYSKYYPRESFERETVAKGF